MAIAILAAHLLVLIAIWHYTFRSWRVAQAIGQQSTLATLLLHDGKPTVFIMGAQVWLYDRDYILWVGFVIELLSHSISHDIAGRVLVVMDAFAIAGSYSVVGPGVNYPVLHLPILCVFRLCKQ